MHVSKVAVDVKSFQKYPEKNSFDAFPFHDIMI